MTLPSPPSPQATVDGSIDGGETLSQWLALLQPAPPGPGDSDSEDSADGERAAEQKGSYAAQVLQWLPEVPEHDLRTVSIDLLEKSGRPGSPDRSISPPSSPSQRKRNWTKSPSESMLLGSHIRRRSYAGHVSDKPMSPTTMMVPAAKMLRRGASEEIVAAVMQSLVSENPKVRQKAAADISYLCAARYPKGFMHCGKWVWTARGADDNRKSLGDDQKLWDGLLRCLLPGDQELAAQVCDALTMLVTKNGKNVVSMIASPGMLTAMVDLLDSEKQTYKVQIQAWQVFQKCVSGDEDVKDVMCNSARFLGYLRKACMCSIEEVRMRAVSVAMNASSDASARLNLNKALVAEQALSTVMLSSEDKMATRLRAAVACANLLGTREVSVLTMAPEMIQELVFGLQASWESRDYAGVRWPLERMILAVNNMSISDSNKEVLVKFGIVPTLMEIVRSYENEVENVYESTLKTLANLTFNDDGKEQMQAADAVTAMDEFQKEVQWDDAQGAREIAQDIVFMLTKAINVEMAFLPIGALTHGRRHVMVSYSPLALEEHVMEVVRSLRNKGFDVWDRQQGSSLRKAGGPGGRAGMDVMAEAMELAEHIVIFVSRAYRESYRCRLEAKFAHIRERAGRSSIYYVMLEEDGRPSNDQSDEWLGNMIGQSQLHAGWDAAGLDAVADRLDDLVRTGRNVCWWDKEESSDSDPMGPSAGAQRGPGLKRPGAVPSVDVSSPLDEAAEGSVLTAASDNLSLLGGKGAGSSSRASTGTPEGKAEGGAAPPARKAAAPGDAEGWKEDGGEQQDAKHPAMVARERFEGSMLKWLTANNLLPLKDILLYHHLDEPELLLRVPDDKLQSLTDRVGLRLRLMRCIQKEREQRRWPPAAAAPDESFQRLHSSTHHSVSTTPSGSVDIGMTSSGDSLVDPPPAEAPVVLVGTGRLFVF